MQDEADAAVGVAACDPGRLIASPVEVIQRGKKLAPSLDRLFALYDLRQCVGLVIGLPKNMDGTEGAAAKDVREFGAALGARLRIAVHFHDERLSSFEADQRMAQSGRTHREKKELRDALAACAILEAYLESGPA